MKRFLTIAIVCLALVLASVVSFSVVTTAESKLGDVNCDGTVDNLDATKILKYDAGLTDLSEYECQLADVNEDGSVDNLDSVLILLYDAGVNDTVNGKAPGGSDSSDDTGSDSTGSDDTAIDCPHSEITIINRVDATVDADGYSGDEYCSQCNTIVNPGIKLDKFTDYDLPLTYYVYTAPSGEQLKLPKGISVKDYTLKRANKHAVSEFEDVEEEILGLVNVEREKEGIAPLENQANAYYFSLIRSTECAESFSHTRPNGTGCFTVFSDYDVMYRTAGENLFMCSSHFASTLAETSVESWMNSEGHRANILNPNFTSISIAVYYDSANDSYYITQLFLG